ncbi:STAS domain-containing protein [Amycolatopsis mongoliensis]|uniref:STAS domain-containing protein n=1 Tax=Amycolatopsis mongoliensis TaxID=715475 RepID=A0A9Y2NEC7_9PSEU|nr:STAS domain-containing protein [Amycolatopsis sp. 4-36]WIX98558.1 STAS domain-containing protein [Amycolatopsis sp. 4-36]
MTAAGTGFTISFAEDDRRIVVRIAGVLDENGSSLVALWLTPHVLLTPERPVVLDLTELTALHHTGLATLADLAELAVHRHCPFELVAGDGDTTRPLRLAGVAGALSSVSRTLRTSG